MEDMAITKRMGGTFRSNTFMQLNKSSRLMSSLGYRSTIPGKPELTSDYTAVVLRALSNEESGVIPANKYVELDTGITISPRGFHALVCLSPDLLEIADATVPTVIMPGMTYTAKLRVKFRQQINVADLPALGYIFLIG